MNIKEFKQIYFVGIGGIGMSALARYFCSLDKNVSGYDRTPSAITDSLKELGVKINFDDNINSVEDSFLNVDETLVIITPAIPKSSVILNYFIDNNYTIIKRAKALGLISNNQKTIGVAGTHGKTSVSTLLSFLLNNSAIGCNAFLGGISKNFESNFVQGKVNSPVVVEADEFDRSFLQLTPASAIITSLDADHLDIYDSHNYLLQSFNDFVNQVVDGGIIIIKEGLKEQLNIKDSVIVKTYSLNSKSEYYSDNIRLQNGRYIFDFVYPEGEIKNLELFVPGLVNVENCVAAIAMALNIGVSPIEIKKSLSLFKGVVRRFDYKVDNSRKVYIDDYAHHPSEIEFTLKSVRELYPDKKITGIFQPHLFSRTRDFAIDFAKELDKFDSIVLLDIYPARELPIEGVTSNIILELMTSDSKQILSKDEVLDFVTKGDFDVLLTLGAGDIDRLVDPIKEIIMKL